MNINQVIATEVMGYQLCKCNHTQLRNQFYKNEHKRRRQELYSYPTGNYFPFGSDNRCNTCRNLYVGVVSYSTRISDAWNVVEKLAEHHAILSGPTIYPNINGWNVDLCLKNGQEVRIADPLLPRAVSKAAVRAIKLIKRSKALLNGSK